MKSKAILRHRALALCAALATLSLSAAEPARSISGSLQANGKSYPLIDVMALPKATGDTLLVAYAATFDRAKLAADGKLDEHEFGSLNFGEGPPLVQVTIAEGGINCAYVYGLQGRKTLCDQFELKLSERSAARVAGTLSAADGADQITLRFDVPIQSTLMVGTALPADGGEPGKALLRHFTAMQSGDFQQVLAAAPPEKRAMMEKIPEAERVKTMAMMRAMSPTQIRITGGSVDGDQAWVQFTGQRDAKALTGTATLERIGQSWMVRKLSTKE